MEERKVEIFESCRMTGKNAKQQKSHLRSPKSRNKNYLIRSSGHLDMYSSIFLALYIRLPHDDSSSELFFLTVPLERQAIRL